MRPTTNHQSNQHSTSSDKSLRINEEIRSKEIRLIDQDGQMIGILPVAEGLRMAKEVGFDLVEISPNAAPPVCKIANFGKMRYEIQKKAANVKKKQKVILTKEVKMSFNIGKGDYDVKIKHTQKFIENGDKVKISIKMRGREITHSDLARKMMDGVLVDTEAFAKAESSPKLEGMQMIVTLVKK